MAVAHPGSPRPNSEGPKMVVVVVVVNIFLQCSLCLGAHGSRRLGVYQIPYTYMYATQSPRFHCSCSSVAGQNDIQAHTVSIHKMSVLYDKCKLQMFKTKKSLTISQGIQYIRVFKSARLCECTVDIQLPLEITYKYILAGLVDLTRMAKHC